LGQPISHQGSICSRGRRRALSGRRNLAARPGSRSPPPKPSRRFATHGPEPPTADTAEPNHALTYSFPACLTYRPGIPPCSTYQSLNQFHCLQTIHFTCSQLNSIRSSARHICARVREWLWHSRCHRCHSRWGEIRVDDRQAEAVVDQLLHRYRPDGRAGGQGSGKDRRRAGGVLLRAAHTGAHSVSAVCTDSI
jgi:hypothetical protein